MARFCRSHYPVLTLPLLIADGLLLPRAALMASFVRGSSSAIASRRNRCCHCTCRTRLQCLHCRPLAVQCNVVSCLQTSRPGVRLDCVKDWHTSWAMKQGACKRLQRSCERSFSLNNKLACSAACAVRVNAGGDFKAEPRKASVLNDKATISENHCAR